jgi:hypothetical protein
VLDLDRYYTPEKIATTVAEPVSGLRNAVCVDAECGQGNLLRAAERASERARCFGMDADREVIASLRREQPEWTLSVGSLTNSRSWSRTSVVTEIGRCDVLLANPPFSMGTKKGILFPGTERRCSVAMAHLRMAIDVFLPRLAVCAIVPESLLHSDLDSNERVLLRENWSLQELQSLKNSTFRGARANASLVLLTPTKDVTTDCAETTPKPGNANGYNATLIRGGLPVHEASPNRKGVPYLHSTDISTLVAGGHAKARVKPIQRGLLSGSAILLPRVGVPSKESIVTVDLDEQTQLSDCVIAIQCSSNSGLERIAGRLRARFDSLRGEYSGTGARYVTVRRLIHWMSMNGIEAKA